MMTMMRKTLAPRRSRTQQIKASGLNHSGFHSFGRIMYVMSTLENHASNLSIATTNFQFLKLVPGQRLWYVFISQKHYLLPKNSMINR